MEKSHFYDNVLNNKSIRQFLLQIFDYDLRSQRSINYQLDGIDSYIITFSIINNTLELIKKVICNILEDDNCDEYNSVFRCSILNIAIDLIDFGRLLYLLENRSYYSVIVNEIVSINKIHGVLIDIKTNIPDHIFEYEKGDNMYKEIVNKVTEYVKKKYIIFRVNLNVTLEPTSTIPENDS